MFQHSIGNAFQIVGIVSLTRFPIGSRTPWETERALRDENPLTLSLSHRPRPLRWFKTVAPKAHGNRIENREWLESYRFGRSRPAVSRILRDDRVHRAPREYPFTDMRMIVNDRANDEQVRIIDFREIWTYERSFQKKKYLTRIFLFFFFYRQSSMLKTTLKVGGVEHSLSNISGMIEGLV